MIAAKLVELTEFGKRASLRVGEKLVEHSNLTRLSVGVGFTNLHIDINNSYKKNMTEHWKEKEGLMWTPSLLSIRSSQMPQNPPSASSSSSESVTHNILYGSPYSERQYE